MTTMFDPFEAQSVWFQHLTEMVLTRGTSLNFDNKLKYKLPRTFFGQIHPNAAHPRICLNAFVCMLFAAKGSATTEE